VRWIVDYKFVTTMGESVMLSTAARDRYRKQLGRYRAAFAEIEPERNIQCALYFPISDEFIVC
jgi:ATP-dependent exoDNAse (exonuclease V) beta subunit